MLVNLCEISAVELNLCARPIGTVTVVGVRWELERRRAVKNRLGV